MGRPVEDTNKQIVLGRGGATGFARFENLNSGEPTVGEGDGAVGVKAENRRRERQREEDGFHTLSFWFV